MSSAASSPAVAGPRSSLLTAIRSATAICRRASGCARIDASPRAASTTVVTASSACSAATAPSFGAHRPAQPFARSH